MGKKKRDSPALIFLIIIIIIIIIIMIIIIMYTLIYNYNKHNAIIYVNINYEIKQDILSYKAEMESGNNLCIQLHALTTFLNFA